MKKKKKLYSYVALFIVAITVCSCLFLFLTKKDENYTYLQFFEKMENDEIESVSYSIKKDTMEGVLKDGTTFVSENPQSEDFKLTLLENDIKVTEVKTLETESVVTIFSLVVMLVFFYIFIGRHYVKNMGGDAKNKYAPISNIPNIKMKDVAGNEEAKENLMDIVEFLKNPTTFQKYGATAPKGVLLEGVPGVGKTLLGKAIAGESKVSFIYVSGSEFDYKWVGEGPARVKELFRQARENEPCIIFIDEIDAIGKKRGDGDSSNKERENTLNQLLTEMDGFSSKENIVVLGATNRKDVLDSAVLRSGRFDRHVQVVPPDLEARIAILKVHAQNKPINEDVDFDVLGQLTIGMTGADLENVMNTAGINAAKAKREDGILMEDITKAFDSIMVGDERKNKKSIRMEDKSITAYHEAGHCLVAKLFDQKVSKVTINPTTKGAGGYTLIAPVETNYETKEEMIQNLKILLAGRAAEEVVFGQNKVTNGASSDLEAMTIRMSHMLRCYGMGNSYGLLNADVLCVNRANEDMLVTEMKNLTNVIYQETKTMITENRRVLEKIKNALLKKETIIEKEIDYIVTWGYDL